MNYKVCIIMTLKEALRLAEELAEAMRPFCQQVGIAGSIRRRKPDNIKDVEIIALPRWTGGAYGEGENLLYLWASSDVARAAALDARGDDPLMRWIKPATGEIVPAEVQPDGRYWRGLLATGRRDEVKLDLFLPLPDGYGAQLLLRTGPAAFSTAVAAHALTVGHQFKDGLLWRSGAVVPTPDEETVFRALGLVYVEPEKRDDRRSLRALPDSAAGNLALCL